MCSFLHAPPNITYISTLMLNLESAQIFWGIQCHYKARRANFEKHRTHHCSKTQQLNPAPDPNHSTHTRHLRHWRLKKGSAFTASPCQSLLLVPTCACEESGNASFLDGAVFRRVSSNGPSARFYQFKPDGRAGFGGCQLHSS